MINILKLKSKSSEVEVEAADSLPGNDTTAFTACFLDLLLSSTVFNRKHSQVPFVQQKEGSFHEPNLSFCHSTHPHPHTPYPLDDPNAG